MIALRLVALLCLFLLINSNPIDQLSSSSSNRHRRSLGFLNWQFVDSIYKRFYRGRNYPRTDEITSPHFESLSESRPVEGPISIEQLPAMLAARQVKQYPYSQQDDPAVIGR